MIRVRPMIAADLPLGLRLCEEAGWNQTVADWQRFLDLQPDGCFVAERDGEAVGTTTTCIFGPVAWIAMVLVAESARGLGIGTALMEHALRFLDERGVATVRLDARPMGQRLYERLGFVEQYRIAHYEGTLPANPRVQLVEDASPGCWEELMELDEQITRTDRRGLLRRLFTEHPQSVRFLRRDGHCHGYWTARPGRKAIRIGPCIATERAGPLPLADAGHRLVGQPVSIDIPIINEWASIWADFLGLTVQHTLARMCRGIPNVEQVECLWASSGPEKG
ncbi:MAG TPA: GNAT family N-acetyltransferase [Gemmataceae bacterium]|jgi:ribosomal protein S18 acetylase RimI-like enzyme